MDLIAGDGQYGLPFALLLNGASQGRCYLFLVRWI